MWQWNWINAHAEKGIFIIEKGICIIMKKIIMKKTGKTIGLLLLVLTVVVGFILKAYAQA